MRQYDSPWVRDRQSGAAQFVEWVHAENPGFCPKHRAAIRFPGGERDHLRTAGRERPSALPAPAREPGKTASPCDPSKQRVREPASWHRLLTMNPVTMNPVPVRDTAR